MGDIVNLRQVRKQRARAGKEKAAEQNRTLFGRSKAERRTAEAERLDADRKLDAHRLDRDDPKR